MNSQRPTPYPPIDSRRASARLLGGGVLLALALSIVGWLIVRVPGLQAWISGENTVNRWLADHRTPQLNTYSHVGSLMSDTIACIALLAVMVIATRVWLGRWREPLALMAAIIGELLVFLVVTAVVQRDRPGVVHLDPAPPTSSFPSGHVAAAVALYGCIAVIVYREMRTRWLASLIVAGCVAIPLVVGASRLYRGMHHPTDVLFGYIGGGLWLVIVVTTILPLPRDHTGTSPSAARAEEPSEGDVSVSASTHRQA